MFSKPRSGGCRDFHAKNLHVGRRVALQDLTSSESIKR